MTTEKLFIFPQDEKANLVTYVRYNSSELKNPPRPAIVVCPGGGYGFLSDREAEPIAIAFMNHGFNAFILNYSIAPNASEHRPLIEAALAIKHVRENAEKYNIDPEKVFIIGFSAGGHLACSTGTLWNTPEVREALGKDAPLGIGKPNGMILAYPVITAFEHTHLGTIHNVCGTETPSEELLTHFSLENQVDATTSPTFIWHTFTDEAVPVQNSLCLAKALTDHGVPFELHIYPEGHHGLSLATEETWSCWDGMIQPAVQGWVDLAARWAKNLK